MTYREAVSLLEGSGVESAAFDAAQLFCRFASVTEASLLADKDRNFDVPELLRAVGERCRRVPLQYILGKWEFFGLEFDVSPHCLCPRGDTEMIVSAVLERLPPRARMLELCTGSGCIPVAVCHTRDDVTAVCTDLFEKTLELAKVNAEKNHVADRIRFLLSDVFERDLSEPDGSFDAIVSNPPYIPSDDIAELSPEVHFEPRSALDGGKDGYDFYREILGYYGRYLKPDGFFALEIGYDQAEGISRIAAANGLTCEIIKDLGGNDRCAVCRFNNIRKG